MNQGGIKTIGRYSYYLGQCLGQGSFGKVFQGFENQTKQKVAIKKVDFKTIQKDSYLEKAIHQQIRILSKFKHPNIVELHQVLNSKRSLYIIMQFCKDGDLKKYLRSKKNLPEAQAFGVMKQIINGYCELAKQKTIHRDLKPANILIKDGKFKICDFGFSKVIKDESMVLKTCVGSPIYMAPQILEKRFYSAKCDIWSLGVIYYELLHGYVPWKARNEKELLENIKKVPLQFFVPCQQSEPIIKSMLQINEQKRANLSDLQKFFGIDVDSVTVPIVQYQKSQQRISSYQPNSQTHNHSVSVQRLQSGTTIDTKVINRNYFEQLAWRNFVCVQIKSRLSSINRYNFSKNIFQRFLVLTVGSIMSNFQRNKPEIDRIHEKEAIEDICRQNICYREFQDELYNYLNDNYSTCQILKQFELADIAMGNFTQKIRQDSQKMLLTTAKTIVFQINDQVKALDSQMLHNSSERNVLEKQRYFLLTICQQIIDMLFLNERQAKSGLADIKTLLKDRKTHILDKRISAKISALKMITTTEFY